jgi:uncharacterized SAM-dependent methyltransferase
MNVHAAAFAKAHVFDEQTSAFGRDVIDDLSQHPKRLSPKYFYDAKGSELFEAITRLPEYYPTRTELGILQERASEISAIVADGAALVEFGAGATTKVRLLLNGCAVGAYVPVDISGDFLTAQAEVLRRISPVSTSTLSLRISPSRSTCRAPSPRCRKSGFSPDRRWEIWSRMKPALSCAASVTFWGKARRW